MSKVVFSCPAPKGKVGGPYSVLQHLREGLDRYFGDDLTIISGDDMPPEAQTLDATAYFDLLASHDFETCRQLRACDKFLGMGSCSLLQIEETRSPRDKTLAKIALLRTSSEPHSAIRAWADEYKKFGLGENPYGEVFMWRGEKEHELADVLITPSEFCSETYRKRLKEVGNEHCRVETVNFGIDCETFSPPDPKQQALKDSQEFNVLFAGGNAIRKGIGSLLLAWNDGRRSELPTKRGDYGRLTLIGVDPRMFAPPGSDDATVKRILDQARIESRTYVEGWVPEEKLPEYFRNASVLCQPSLEEGMSLVIGQALASGVPVILTEECGWGGIVEDGKQGFVIKPRDPKAIQKALSYFRENVSELKRMGKEARILAERLPWTAFEDGVAKIVESM